MVLVSTLSPSLSGPNRFLAIITAGSSFPQAGHLGFVHTSPRAYSLLPVSLLCFRQGLDWRGPSTQDAWGSLDALVAILEANSVWHAWKLTENTPVVVMGHSNGAQGAWYLASRYPDRVLGGMF